MRNVLNCNLIIKCHGVNAVCIFVGAEFSSSPTETTFTDQSEYHWLVKSFHIVEVRSKARVMQLQESNQQQGGVNASALKSFIPLINSQQCKSAACVFLLLLLFTIIR